jgi:mono/diheme cytochrome c family protein
MVLPALALVLGLLVLGFCVLTFGFYDVSASTKPSGFERAAAHFIVEHSVARRAPKGPNPLHPSPDVLQSGLSLYRENCVVCHGVPGEPQSNIALGLNPAAPDLSDEDAQESSDGELFQVIAQGLRMTAMPAFSKSNSQQALWTLVTFVRHLPKLTDEERRALSPHSS